MLEMIYAINCIISTPRGKYDQNAVGVSLDGMLKSIINSYPDYISVVMTVLPFRPNIGS
jgi:hypothetical protein